MIPTFKRVVGRQHHIYKHADVDDILDYLTSNPLERGAISKIARDTGIPDSTLRHWHRQRAADSTWFPLAMGHPQARALDSDAEAAIADFVRVNYVHTGIGATRKDLRELCLTAYSEQTDDERHLERFCASSRFLRGLERRQQLSLRTPHKERRTIVDENVATYFLNRLNSLSDDYPPDMVFNMDETCWRLFESPRKVLAEKGTETVKLCSKSGEKTSFTALGAISAAGQKLPLWVLAKGRTQRSERKFGAHEDVVVHHSTSGWATENIIIAYIGWLHRQVADGAPCVLILDVYPTHRTDRVFAAAQEDDVELLFVPAGGTGRFQPMDRRIFGELKARARAAFDRRRWLAGGNDIDYDESVEVLARCWRAIPAENVRKAWNVV